MAEHIISWSLLPPEYTFVAIDRDGEIYAYTVEPVIDTNYNCWVASAEDGMDEMHIGHMVMDIPDWTKSVVER